MMETDTADVTDSEIERHWTIVLGEFWLATDWEQFPDTKRRSATFEERLLNAQNSGDVHGALKKLAKGLNMASPDLPTENLDTLVENGDEAMRVLRREDIYLVAKTKETVQNYFNGKDAPDSVPEPTTSTLSDFITEDD